MELQTLTLSVTDHVATVTLCRGAALNTMNAAFWTEMPQVFAAIDADPSVRAVVIASTGKHFTAGLDLGWAGQSLTGHGGDAGRAREAFLRHVRGMQATFNVIDRARMPVIAAVQGGCIGAGVDLVTACDLRVGTEDCFFTVQEINVGIVADVGTLQRLPYLLPHGLVRELAYTGRRFGAAEARSYGFLNHVEPDAAAVVARAQRLAAEIATKSPLAVMGIKHVLNHGRGATVEAGLDYVALWNAAMLQGDDMPAAVGAQLRKEQATFADLLP